MINDIIRKVNQALKNSEDLSSNNLPKAVRFSIMRKKYTSKQLNEAYAKVLKVE